MRPKILIVLLVLAVLILGAAFLLKQHLGNQTPPPAVEMAAPAPADSNAQAVATPPPAPPAPVTAPAMTNTLTADQRQDAIDAEVDRLQDWSMNDDPASLSNIVADLTNSEKEIREAAIEATKQFGSTNAIPALKAAANSTDDTQEKIDYLEAADFLSLPPLDLSSMPAVPEQVRQKRAADAAARLAQAQKAAEKQAAGQNTAPNQNQPASDQNQTTPDQNQTTPNQNQ